MEAARATPANIEPFAFMHDRPEHFNDFLI
jgi:hypothetical protein